MGSSRAGYLESDCSRWVVGDPEPLIPPSKVRPQGDGTQGTPDETLFAAIIYVLSAESRCLGPAPRGDPAPP